MKKLMTFGVTTLLTFTAFAEPLSSFKMAVVRGSDGAIEIRKGDYEKGIQQIVKKMESSDAEEQLSMHMNLCVAYSSTKQFALADQACNSAIDLAKSIAQTNHSAARLVSLALNNRAILKTKVNEFEGALQDLVQAAAVKNTSIVEGNLLKLIYENANNIQFTPLQLTQL